MYNISGRCERTCPGFILDGMCVDIPIFTNYTQSCDLGQWYFNNTCVPACREGEFLDATGHCVNPADMCKRSIPGAVYNATSYTCGCAVDSWIKRNDSFVPPIACAPVPSMIPRPYPRIACKSFIPNTVYDFDLDACICEAATPVVIPNPKDTFVPYLCAPVGTATTIKQCLPPTYFDFTEGGCVGGKDTSAHPTVRPSSASSTDITMRPLPTRTAMPSRFPSPTPSTTRHGSTASVSRTAKPSARIFADIVRSPLPSVKPVPPPENVRKSPAPSPWTKKMTLDIPPEERPSYINARVSLPGGNATEIARPEKIQEMQATLACTLRMPLENIRIQNITVRDIVTGATTKIPVDPTEITMMGNGDTACYDFRNQTTTAGARRLRRALGTAVTTTVDVDYTIVEPSVDILSLSVSEFTNIVASSPIMMDMAASVGSTGVTASAVEAAAAPSSAPTTDTSAGAKSSSLMTSGDYIGAGIGGLAGLAMIITLAIFYYKETKRLREKGAKAAQAPRVVIMHADEHQTQNPMQAVPFATHVGAIRMDYGPESTRRASMPLRTTHGSMFSITGGSAV